VAKAIEKEEDKTVNDMDKVERWVLREEWVRRIEVLRSKWLGWWKMKVDLGQSKVVVSARVHGAFVLVSAWKAKPNNFHPINVSGSKLES
jgi:hypothetical protein